MSTNPIKAYENVERATIPGRELEASVLIRAAALLKHCQDNWKGDILDDNLRDALVYNQKVWSIFQGELVRPDHPLPLSLRQDILRLSLFIDQRILDIMASPSPEKLNVIIQINQNLAAGLRGLPQSS
ncbi:MAG TPA: flagellar biosynthesis regulator FlaF [Nitrospiria bacterium]|nr:flagellar biosynthesis regulator FlaF [Nitrospiria bacterium]